MRRISIVAVSLIAFAPALAGRAVTDAEKAKLMAAIAAQECTGGEMEFDDGKFEVDDANCKDGKIYDLDFDPSFKLISKKPET